MPGLETGVAPTCLMLEVTRGWALNIRVLV